MGKSIGKSWKPGEVGPNRIEELPPSAKLVLKVLEYIEELTQRELIEETLLPSRTVRYALARLEKARLIEVRFATSDARIRIYSIIA